MKTTPKERREKLYKKYRDKWNALDPYTSHLTGLKTCPECSTEKSVRSFSKLLTAADGLQAKCKECQKARHKAAMDRNKLKWENGARLLTEKRCCKCKQTLNIKHFNIANTRPDGFQNACKSCVAKRHRKSKYGIEQPKGDKCDICGKTETLSIDHCHKTNNLRGTLCRACNTGIGLLGDSLDTLQSALNYLTAWHTVNGLK